MRLDPQLVKRIPGFPPPLLINVNYFGGHSEDELVLTVIKSLEKMLALAKEIKKYSAQTQRLKQNSSHLVYFTNCVETNRLVFNKLINFQAEKAKTSTYQRLSSLGISSSLSSLSPNINTNIGTKEPSSHSPDDSIVDAAPSPFFPVPPSPPSSTPSLDNSQKKHNRETEVDARDPNDNESPGKKPKS